MKLAGGLAGTGNSTDRMQYLNANSKEIFESHKPAFVFNYFCNPFVLILLACFDLARPLDRSDGCSSLQQCDSSDAGFIVNEIKLILNYRNKFLSLLIFIFFYIKMFFLMNKPLFSLY